MPTSQILAIVDGVTCEVLDTQDGRVEVRALEGKPWKTCSFLRHHSGVTFDTAYMTFPRERVEIHPDTLSRWGVTDKDGYGNPIPVVVEKELVMA